MLDVPRHIEPAEEMATNGRERDQYRKGVQWVELSPRFFSFSSATSCAVPTALQIPTSMLPDAFHTTTTNRSLCNL